MGRLKILLIRGLSHTSRGRNLDAPVSGGDTGAKNAALTIMAGGDEEAYEKAMPLFRCMGKTMNYMGGAGMGQHTKACNQIGVAGATAAYTEALSYALRVGLDPERMLAAIAAGSAGSWQIDHMAPRALSGDHPELLGLARGRDNAPFITVATPGPHPAALPSPVGMA